MKTVEEKAKAFDKFCEILEKLHQDDTLSEDQKCLVNKLLSELNGSDKSIVETLINMFTNYYIEKVGEFTNDQIVGWLKEQLKKPEKYEWSGKITSRKAKGKLNELLEELESRKKIDNRPIFRIGDTLKKKGKDYTFTVDRIQGGYYHCDRNNGAFFPIEEQYDWELLDDGKTSPKFKIGDWVVDNCGNIWKIEGIINQFYILEGVEGGESRPTIEWVNKTFHLWTIEDAKDGDMLVSTTWKENQYIYIFKNIENNTIISYIYYCPKLDAVNMGAINMDNTPTVPATKEQQELLFSKIKDEGYKWDDTEKLGVDVVSMNQKDPSITKRNLTWSEEDEVMCQETIDWFEQKCFPYASEEENPARKSIQWLKSLKQRLQ